MRYTFFCRLGRYGRPGLHYVYIGGWIRPGPEYVILQHGNLTGSEYRQICRDGCVKVMSDRNNHIGIYQEILTSYRAKKYHYETARDIGTLYKNKDNIYIGRVRVYSAI